jgi:flagella basal body P-ring formation protein FlgA
MRFKLFWLTICLAAGLWAAEITPAELLAAGVREIQSLPRFADKEVSLNFVKIPETVVVDTENYTLKTELKEVAPSLYIRYSVYAGDKFLKGFRIKYNAVVWGDAYYAGRRLARGEEAFPEDFYLHRTDILRHSRYLVESGSEWTDKVLTADLKPDDPLFAWMLGLKYLVSSGEIITLEVLSDGVTIRAKAKALQAGLLGDKIRVQLQNEKKKVMQAEITGSGECRIRL